METQARTDSGATFGLIVGTVANMVYTVMVGFGLIAGTIPVERSHLLMVIPCVAPAIWNLYGFLKADAGDNGLLISGVGWFMGAMALLTQQLVVAAQITAGIPVATVPISPPAMMCGGVAITLLITGAIVSWQNLQERLRHS